MADRGARTVQYVGFRPFVHWLATAIGIGGQVRNAGGHVVISAIGPPEQQVSGFEIVEGLSGGVFQNRLPATDVPPRLSAAGFEPYTGERVRSTTPASATARRPWRRRG
ncbi:hydrogenase maturation protein HypF [Nonomuraea solani]|uniref:acylphosphatase n=1 Tax=Nonomuraea solani TaxID=1144553 RepID=A0A1H6EXS0_9ACTN|nr:acylphosphatase [Nonomuraea solani]SEH02680.1 hydrogenase maturation protein HypF [Nonomuraea solani]